MQGSTGEYLGTLATIVPHAHLFENRNRDYDFRKRLIQKIQSNYEKHGGLNHVF